MSSRKDLVGALTSLLRLLRTADDLSHVLRSSIMANAEDVAERAERGLIEPVPWTPFEERRHLAPSTTQIRAAMKQANCSEADARAMFARERTNKLYVNSRYQVAVEVSDAVTHLSIKRIDQQPVHDWRDLQRIKNELCGPECEGVELYPAEGRVVDIANQYHLWVVRDRIPLGFTASRVAGAVDANAIGAAQREREA
jgi:hypothetical protein